MQCVKRGGEDLGSMSVEAFDRINKPGVIIKRPHKITTSELTITLISITKSHV